MPRLKQKQNRRTRKKNNLTSDEAHNKVDSPAEPEVPREAAVEDASEEQNNEFEDATDAVETAEDGVVEEAVVTETPRRKRKRKLRPNGGTLSTTAGHNSQNEKREITMAGMIFMCSTATKKDCFKYGVFGFPEQKKDSVTQVKKGMKLFLYDVDKKHLHGVYQASSRGGMNLVPEAFEGSARKFPAQVKFRIHKDCMPLQGPAFKEAIKDNLNRGGRFNVELTVEQVRKLMKLFRPVGSEILPEATQRRRGRERQREFPSSHDAHRGPSRGGHAQRGLSQDQHVARLLLQPVPAREPVRSREPVYSMESNSHYARERLPIDLNYIRAAQPSYLPASQVSSYPPQSQIATTEAEAAAARRRYLDALHLQEASVIGQRVLPYDPLYRGTEYQREVPHYNNYGVSRSLGFPY